MEGGSVGSKKPLLYSFVDSSLDISHQTYHLHPVESFPTISAGMVHCMFIAYAAIIIDFSTVAAYCQFFFLVSRLQRSYIRSP